MSCSERAGHLALGHEVVAYCPSCGDEAPGIPYTAGTLDRAPAQLYMRSAADHYANLATLVGCEVPAGTPRGLHIERDHGVLIVPDPVVPMPARSATAAHWELAALPVLLLLWVGIRRRRTMVPRAVNL